MLKNYNVSSVFLKGIIPNETNITEISKYFFNHDFLKHKKFSS